MKKNSCSYDGMTKRDAAGRCLFCGMKRLEAKLAARKWERDHRYLGLAPVRRSLCLPFRYSPV